MSEILSVHSVFRACGVCREGANIDPYDAIFKSLRGVAFWDRAYDSIAETGQELGKVARMIEGNS
jgi:hypothetical protein